MSRYEALFSPGRIGPLELPNRVVLAPMGSNYPDENHMVTERLIAYHVARARGGMGLNIVEHTAVHPWGLTGSRMLAIYDDAMIPGLSALASAVHEAGGRIAVQLQHGGRQASPEVIGRKPLAPSAVPAGRDRRVPDKMSVADIEEAIAAFGEGARRAQQSGMDGVEVHMAHGYLGCSFLSPLLNRRDDEFGGDTGRRTEFARRVRRAIRERCGDDFACWCRISADEFVEGGTDLAEAQRFAPLLEEAGYDAIHVSVCIGETACYASAPYYLPPGHLLQYAAGIKQVVSVPVIAVGRIVEPAMADEAIREGKCDFVAIGRASLADPDWPNKAREGRDEQIIRCFACNLGCSDRSYSPEGQVQCTANPWTGREVDWPDWPDGPKPPSRRRVLVIGAGPAGMQAAITAARRGHDVTLWERAGDVGGQWALAAMPPGKSELASMIRWMLGEMDRAGVKLVLDREATADDVLDFDPD
ncbi:MAG TPA: FAD-dependent oxidoreductase, partial [Armatimonadota bacterium]|nr:FAD-dependent oxidoreductase [Armatimonadota bacterium]